MPTRTKPAAPRRKPAPAARAEAAPGTANAARAPSRHSRPAAAAATARPAGDAAPTLKEACVRAAHEVIAEQGVDQLSLRDVARRLGVSHQAPYRHFASRDHLLAEVIRRCFAQFAAALDARPRHAEPHADLGALGRAYLAYAAAHPLEYRLMFGTPWPAPAQHPALVRDAVHALDVLRDVLRRVHGDAGALRAHASGAALRAQAESAALRAQAGSAALRAAVDRDAMFIWSAMHGLAAIASTPVMEHLALAPGVARATPEHVLAMIGRALGAPPGR